MARILGAARARHLCRRSGCARSRSRQRPHACLRADEALETAMAMDYLDQRAKCRRRWESSGVLTLDATPDQLCPSLIQRYWDIKKASKSLASSAGGPLHGSTAEDVHMHMSDGLAAVGFAVDERSARAFSAQPSPRARLCLVDDLPQESRVLRGESSSSTCSWAPIPSRESILCSGSRP